MIERWKQDGKKLVEKSPEEWAAESAGANGWECPRCGCKDWRVVDSKMNQSGRRRTRVCRHCGKEQMHTLEVPVPDGHKVTVGPIAET